MTEAVLSRAVQMLIDRMKSHPDDFFGPVGFDGQLKGLREFAGNPRFRLMAKSIERHIIGAKDRDESSADPFWHLTAIERDALHAAFMEARRIRFDAEIIHAIIASEEAPPRHIRISKYIPTT